MADRRLKCLQARSHVIDELLQETTFAHHFVAVASQHGEHSLCGRGPGRRSVATELEQRPLDGMTVPEQRLEMREGVYEMDVQDLELLFEVVRSHLLSHVP